MRYLIAQPNGLYGIFSEQFRDFEQMNIRESDVAAICDNYCMSPEISDVMLWDDCIRVILGSHGKDKARDRIIAGDQQKVSRGREGS